MPGRRISPKLVVLNESGSGRRLLGELSIHCCETMNPCVQVRSAAFDSSQETGRQFGE